MNRMQKCTVGYYYYYLLFVKETSIQSKGQFVDYSRQSTGPQIPTLEQVL